MPPPSDPSRPDQVSRREFLTRVGGTAALVGLAGADILQGQGAPPPGPNPGPVGKVGELNLSAIRQQFLLEEGLVYMNNGSLGPSPRSVLDQAMEAWREIETDPVTKGFGPFIQKMEQVREKAAKFLGCSTDEIAITRNTTEGMNMVAQGMNLEPGDSILTTDHEHPGGFVGWEYYVKRRKVKLERVELPVPPKDADDIVRRFEDKLTPETKVISVSHVTFTTGLQLPVKRLAGLARQNGSLLAVDGAQAPGVLEVNVKGLDCDTYATSAHKWMLAPKGTGLLYIRKEAQKAVQPIQLQHGMRAYTASAGTRNIPTIVGLGAAIDFLNTVGLRRIQQHARAIRGRICEELTKLPALQLVSPRDGELASALVTFRLPDGASASELVRTLREKHDVVVKPVPGNHVNGIRISSHIYNSEQDVTRLHAALQKELG